MGRGRADDAGRRLGGGRVSPLLRGRLGVGPVEAASAWVRRFAPLIARGGTVLDVACGGGRHTRWLREREYRVVAVDVD
ncbi:MAG: class I SAM-dependent methyltransferase, partial [Egibacteraceae bacterium]